MATQPHRLAVVGLGHVGEAVLGEAMAAGVFAEIVCLDVVDGLAAGHALDQHHGTALPGAGNVRVHAGGYGEVAGCDVVIVCAGPSITLDGGPVTSDMRRSLAATNGAVAREVMGELTSRHSDAVVIFISNPLDALVQIATTEFDHPAGKVFGTGTMLDSARMRRAIGDHLGIDPHQVHGFMLGEHGPSGFPMTSGVRVAGLGWDDLPGAFGVPELPREELMQQVNDAGFQVLLGKGWTNSGVARAAVQLARCVVMDEHAVWPVCVTLRGEYGHDGDVSLSTPCVIGAAGVERVVEVPLDDWERERMAATVEVIQATVEAAGGRIL